MEETKLIKTDIKSMRKILSKLKTICLSLIIQLCFGLVVGIIILAYLYYI